MSFMGEALGVVVGLILFIGLVAYTSNDEMVKKEDLRMKKKHQETLRKLNIKK